MRSSKGKCRWLSAFAVAIAVLNFSGCGRAVDDNEQEHLQRAKSFRDEGKLEASVIELKNALQKNPDNAQARLLLGEVYLDLGRPPDAEKELLKAKQLGAAEDSVKVPLGKALLAEGLFKRVISDINVGRESPLPLQARIIELRGQAYLQLRQLDEACPLFSQSLAMDSSYVPAYWGLTRCAAANGNLGQSRTYLEQALKLEDKNSGTWAMLGELERATGNLSGAEAAYAKALEYKPGSLDALLGRATVRIDAQKPDEASQDVDAALKIANRHPTANHLRGVIEYGRGNYAEAKVSFETALAALPGYPPAVLWLGYTNYAQKNYAQAEDQFAQYLRQAPNAVQVTALRALCQIRIGRKQAAQEALASLRKVKFEDVQSLTALGEGYLLLGENELAAQYFQQVVATAPEQAKPRIGLANALLKKGKSAQAIEQLEKAVALSPDNAEANERLMQALIQGKQYDQALAAIKRFEARQPKSPLPHHYRGLIALQQGNAELAEAEFLQVWQLVPGHPRAGNDLASLALRKGQVEQARDYYQKVLERNPDDLRTLLALSELEQIAKRPDEATKILENALAKHPAAPQPAVLLARRYVAAGQPLKAIEVTQMAARANPDDPGLLGALGMAYMASGDSVNALASYKRLVNALPDSADAYASLGAAQAATKDPLARASLARALKLAPTHAGAKLALARLGLQEGKTDEALRLGREMSKEHPAQVDGVLVEAEALARQKRLPEALKLLEQAQKAQPTSDRVTFALANLRWTSGDKEGSLRTVAQWEEQHPDDVAATMQAAQAYVTFGREAQAAEAYEKALKLAPSNPMVLNNMAWAVQKTDPKRALELAEKAHALKPGDAGITDTLGWLLVQQFATARGLELLQEAHQLTPRSPTIHYHYAVALVKSGQQERARRELESLLASAKGFAQEAEARSLLRQL
jgi:putative PEP-CTERM system TPR-repeat lipoprotein